MEIRCLFFSLLLLITCKRDESEDLSEIALSDMYFSHVKLRKVQQLCIHSCERFPYAAYDSFHTRVGDKVGTAGESP